MTLGKLFLLAALAATTIGLAACGDKGPVAELKAAEDAIAAANAAQVDPANPDLKKAVQDLESAQAEINYQKLNARSPDFTAAKAKLAEAKSLSEKALADHKSGIAKPSGGADDASKVSTSTKPRIKS